MQAERRFRTVQAGIETWHTLSAGPHYDPDHLSRGPIVGIDEHIVEPGAGFDWHAHRGVVIVSWILEGMLQHEGSGTRLVVPGELLVQSAGDGIRHRETNASDVEQLRFLQVTILADGPLAVRSVLPPATVAGVSFELAGGELDVSLAPAPRVDVWSASNSAD